MGLLASCLEMSRGGKHSSCNGTNIPPRSICGLQKEIIQKGKISFSVQFLSNGRSEIFLDKQDSVVHPDVEVFVTCMHVRVCMHGRGFSSLQNFASKPAIWRA